MSALNDVVQWPCDGQGCVHSLGQGAWRIEIESPFTLWYPVSFDDDIDVSFYCTLHTENSAMLILACAQAWRGDGSILDRHRSGDYKEYAYGDLEMYSVGFNRTSHVSNDRQPNASSLNVRRIGGLAHQRFADLTLKNQSDAAREQWRRWDRATLLCSVSEPLSGVGKPLHYRMRFSQGCISVSLQGQPLVTVNDHHPCPLSGGLFAIRNMTPGACFEFHDLTFKPASPGRCK